MKQFERIWMPIAQGAEQQRRQEAAGAVL